jgi:hypothetical protein
MASFADATTATLLWTAAGFFVAFGLFAAWAERRRARRADLDSPGYVPWHGLQVFAFILAVVAAALAIKA